MMWLTDPLLRCAPLDSPDVLTAWIPLQPTPQEMGPLAFARGADT